MSKFIPDDFIVPEKLETREFRLRMLKAADVEKDYEAVMSSRDHILKLYKDEGIDVGTWPEADMTIEEDLEDLQRHEKEFLDRSAFAYTVMSIDESTCLGCVYIDPSDEKSFDAEVTLWARASEVERGLEETLFKTVKGWIKDKWPFKKVAYPGFEVQI